MFWKGHTAMLHDMDGVVPATQRWYVPAGATLFMFKINKWNECTWAMVYDEEKLKKYKFTHVGWKTFKTAEEREEALENVKWFYTTISGDPRRYK